MSKPLKPRLFFYKINPWIRSNRLNIWTVHGFSAGTFPLNREYNKIALSCQGFSGEFCPGIILSQ
jgi:hypothetical protein